MKFRLVDNRVGPDQDLMFIRGGNTSTAVSLTWSELLDLRNFLDVKLGERERETRARARRSEHWDDDSVSLHVVEG